MDLRGSEDMECIISSTIRLPLTSSLEAAHLHDCNDGDRAKLVHSHGSKISSVWYLCRSDVDWKRTCATSIYKRMPLLQIV